MKLSLINKVVCIRFYECVYKTEWKCINHFHFYINFSVEGCWARPWDCVEAIQLFQWPLAFSSFPLTGVRTAAKRTKSPIFAAFVLPFFKCSWQQRLQKEKLGINPDTWLLHVTRSISEDYWKLSIIKALNGPSACYCRILTCQHAAHEQKITIGRNLTGSPLLSLGNLTLVPFFRTALGLWSACACMNKIVRATETTQKEPPSGCIWMWHFYLCFSQQICSAMMRSMRQSSHRIPWSHFDMSPAGMEAGRAAMND